MLKGNPARREYKQSPEYLKGQPKRENRFSGLMSEQLPPPLLSLDPSVEGESGIGCVLYDRETKDIVIAGMWPDAFALGDTYAVIAQGKMGILSYLHTHAAFFLTDTHEMPSPEELAHRLKIPGEYVVADTYAFRDRSSVLQLDDLDADEHARLELIIQQSMEAVAARLSKMRST